MLLVLFVSFLSVILIVVKYYYSFWFRNGFPSITPSFPFGCLGPVAVGKKSMGELMRGLHLNSKERFLGIYFFWRPVLLIRDPDLVKRVLITDFDHFQNRGVHYDEVADPLGSNLFGMVGQEWKNLRAKLSPTFSSGKIKNMFPAIEKNCQRLEDFLDTKEEVQMREVMLFYNSSIIAEVLFGFQLNVFENQQHEFKKIGELFFDVEPIRNKIAMMGFFLFPSLLKMLKMSVLSPSVSKYTLNLVNNVIETRKKDISAIRPDFIQTMIELMKDPEFNLTVEACTAEVLVFYVAGYETSASTTAYCMYELSKQPEMMDKVRQEIDPVMKKRNGNLLMEDLSQLKFLDMCVNETMRKYPVVPFLNRECTKDYKIPGSDRVIRKGTPIIISNYGLHWDQNNYPSPETFDPYRFETEHPLEEMPFYPLGGGPKYCIGGRLGYMMIRMALCTMIYNFDIEPIDPHLEFKPGGIALADTKGVRLRIKKRCASHQ